MHLFRTSIVRISATAATMLVLGACSVWQNAPRKYLEKSSYDYTGLKLHEQLIGCAAPNDDASWTEESRDERARVSSRTVDADFELRVEPTSARGDFVCDYKFTNESERTEWTDAAIAHTLSVSVAP